MRKKILIAFIVFIVIIIGINISFADMLFERPIEHYAFTNIRKPTSYMNGFTIKEIQDDLLYKNKIKKTYNKEIEVYDKPLVFCINRSLYTYTDDKLNGRIKTIFDKLTILGEDEKFYITSDKTFIKKEDLEETLGYDEKSGIKDDKYLSKVEFEDEVSKKVIDEANTYWNSVPYNIRKYLIKNGWKVCITNKNLQEEYYEGRYNSVAGVTLSNEKQIYLENRLSAINISMIHEVGHAVDLTKQCLSKKQDFIKIYNEEVGNYVNLENKNMDHINGDSMEYFAEAFNQTILYDKRYEKHAQKTYDYMQNLIKNIK